MTNNEKIINIAGLTYTLRDLLEDSEFDREFKMRVKKLHCLSRQESKANRW